MRRYKLALYFAVVIGLIVGGLSVYIGLQHNTQGEMDFSYSVIIFLSWFLIASLVAGFVGAIVTLFAGLMGFPKSKTS